MAENETPNNSSSALTLYGRELFLTMHHVSVTKSSAVPKYLGKLHYHDFIEIVFIISGSALAKIGDETFHCKKNDLIIINFNKPHMFIGDKNSDNPFCAYDLAFNPDYVDTSLIGQKYFENTYTSFLFSSLLPNSENVTPFVYIPDTSPGMFNELFAHMYSEYSERKHGYIDMLRAKIIELLILIDREINTMCNINFKDTKQQIADNVIKYIQSHYSEKITINDIARHVFLTPDYLNRIIKKETGMTFGMYLKHYRIQNVCHMLTRTQASIKEIMYQCGFQDAKYFFSTFKREMGVTPAQYREINRK